MPPIIAIYIAIIAQAGFLLWLLYLKTWLQYRWKFKEFLMWKYDQHISMNTFTHILNQIIIYMYAALSMFPILIIGKNIFILIPYLVTLLIVYRKINIQDLKKITLYYGSSKYLNYYCMPNLVHFHWLKNSSSQKYYKFINYTSGVFLLVVPIIGFIFVITTL